MKNIIKKVVGWILLIWGVVGFGAFILELVVVGLDVGVFLRFGVSCLFFFIGWKLVKPRQYLSLKWW